MISLFMVLPLMHVWITSVEFLTDAETNLVLNFEKCHFMVHGGIVLGHSVSSRGIEVDKAKIDVITSLPYDASVREVRSFLRHPSFTRDLSRILARFPCHCPSFIRRMYILCLTSLAKRHLRN